MLTWNWDVEYRLVASTSVGGTIDVSDGWYADGAGVSVTATAADHWRFSRWTGSGTNYITGDVNTTTVTLTVTTAMDLQAEFAITPSGTLIRMR